MSTHSIPRAIALAYLVAAPLMAQTSGQSILVRRYREGEAIHYVMDATNQGRAGTLSYSAQADGIVRKDSLGRFIEELEWSNLMRDGRPVVLQPGGPGVRQRLTLAPDYMIPPNVAGTDQRLIGPVLDLFTFYADLWLAAQVSLTRAGDHARVPRSSANSWADGHVVTLGEDAIDFEITLVSVDAGADRARLEVRHVPPAKPIVHFPTNWMQVPLFDTPNNWVEVTKTNDTSYVAGVGRETFDVTIDVRLTTGAIVTATMDNPVDLAERVCRDASLTTCGEPYRYRIFRRISLRAR